MRKADLLRREVARDASMQDLFSELREREARVAQLGEKLLQLWVARDRLLQ